MLVLTRKQQDTIRIGDTIVVTVVRIKGNTVRLGIEAPDDVRVVRGEVHARETAQGPGRMEVELDLPTAEDESLGELSKPACSIADSPIVAV